jgi:protein required for attachment to host cells
MPQSAVTWIVVMDSAQARIFSLRTGRDGRELSPAMPSLLSTLGRRSQDERSDKPGRSFASVGTVRHAIEPKHDYHKLAKHDFARTVAALVEKGLAARQFNRLVLVAPRRTLGELRALMSKRIKQRIQREVAKDFALLGPQELWTRIAPVLMPSATTPRVGIPSKINGKTSNSSEGAIVVMFRKLGPSQAIQDSVLRHAEKLRRVYTRITSCKVVVEGGRGRHRKGPVYRVYVDLRIPGRTITATSTARQEHAHDDVYAAIREGFAAARAQLVNRRASNITPQGARSSSLRSRAQAV